MGDEGRGRERRKMREKRKKKGEEEEEEERQGQEEDTCKGNLREAREMRKPKSIMKPMGGHSCKRKELSKALKTPEK